MEYSVNKIVTAKLGPVPVPYLILVFIIPSWTFFSSDERSLIFSMFIIATTILKGSLFLYWTQDKVSLLLLWIVLRPGVYILQAAILHYSLQASVIPAVIVLLPSTETVILIVRFHRDDLGVGDEKYKYSKPAPRSTVPVRSRQVVVIFSRSSEENYRWLSALLRDAAKVVHFQITNRNYGGFTQQVSQCSFAILYHTKTHGRVNITNVTDSLYDEELDYLHKHLGQKNVAVVADDLDDSSSLTKNNILKNQTSIRDKTCDLFLFTPQDKVDPQFIRNKIKPLIDMLGKGSCSYCLADLVVALLILAPWFYFAVTVYNAGYLISTNCSGSALLYYALFPLHPSAYTLGIAVVLVLLAAELVTVVWIPSVCDMVLLILQSVATGILVIAQALY
ncbi:uncharacterized protein LOC134945653 isoform X2 [Pseudophryne corroboree]|uniref:uncharacterized protein LOC134945653 isoform X2 n=1 Tax=Pseudophryne corroboree TaxID=495146 RepID=UPI0030821C5E